MVVWMRYVWWGWGRIGGVLRVVEDDPHLLCGGQGLTLAAEGATQRRTLVVFVTHKNWWVTARTNQWASSVKQLRVLLFLFQTLSTSIYISIMSKVPQILELLLYSNFVYYWFNSSSNLPSHIIAAVGTGPVCPRSYSQGLVLDPIRTLDRSFWIGVALNQFTHCCAAGGLSILRSTPAKISEIRFLRLEASFYARSKSCFMESKPWFRINWFWAYFKDALF